MKVFTAEQMRAFDRAATEEYGIPSIVLMENAALRVVEFLEMKFSPLGRKKMVVLCGKGNNGGDGLAIARHLSSLCNEVCVYLACSPDELKGDALVNYQTLVAARKSTYDSAIIVEVVDDNTLNAIYGDVVVVDALLGTGFKGEVRGKVVEAALEFLHTTPHPVVAVDLPSGMNADTGAMAPRSPYAKYTVTLASPKRGLFLREGLLHAGEVWVGSIGTLPAINFGYTGCECITQDDSAYCLPRRALDAHKGGAGRVVICGGSYGMSGAPALAARAALRIGAGLCIACVPDKILPIFATTVSEATSHPLVCDEAGNLTEAAADAMAEHWKSAHVVALGPGLSRAEASLNFARRVVRECPHPLIIDADALYALRAIEKEVHDREADTILTPHPGEMGELMELTTSEVQNDRIGVAVQCAKRYNAIVVLKGARSIVAIPFGEAHINLTGNSGMATGGSGDVLTGTIAGLIPQFEDFQEDCQHAVRLAVYLHGLAGDLAFAKKGNGLIAGDIAEALPRAIFKLQEPPEESPNGRLRRLV